MVYRRTRKASSLPMRKKIAKKRAVPARFPSGKKNYQQTRKVAKMIQNISETKIKALSEKNAVVPKPVELLPTTGPCYFTNYCLGEAPAAWVGPNGAAAFEDLGGFEWAPGTAAGQRVGKYLYLKRTTLQLTVRMNQLSRHGPLKFRVIIYKEKRNRYNVAGNGNPCDDLFIDHAGDVKGVNNLATTNARAMNFSTWLVNKRNYQVVSDKQFILAPEQNSAQGSTDPFNINQHNPVERNMSFSLGHYSKAEFDGTNKPTDVMYRYCATIISMPVSTSTSIHNEYSTYVRGTVSVVDN
jgi:hypothetical protein